jgi:hypothetical protein
MRAHKWTDHVSESSLQAIAGLAVGEPVCLLDYAGDVYDMRHKVTEKSKKDAQDALAEIWQATID